MRKKIFTTFVMCLSTFFYTFADEPALCFDANFSSEVWLNAFQATTGTDIRTQAVDYGINVVDATEVTVDGMQFYFNGNVHRYIPFTSVCGLNFEYDFRLRNGGGTNIIFPEYEDVGKITLYVRNQNPDNDNILNLQKYDGIGEVTVATSWNTIHTWTVPKNTDAAYNGFNDFELTYTMTPEQGDGPVRFRIQRNEARFTLVFRIILEHNDNYVSAIPKQQISNTDVFASNGILYIRSDEQKPVTVNVYDLMGRKIFQNQTSENRITLPAIMSGIFLVKLTKSGTEAAILTKKIKL